MLTIGVDLSNQVREHDAPLSANVLRALASLFDVPSNWKSAMSLASGSLATVIPGLLSLISALISRTAASTLVLSSVINY